MKTCSKCKLTKSLGAFGRLRNSPDGLNWYCKECINLVYQDRKEKHKKKMKEWREQNPDYFKKYRVVLENKEREVENHKEWVSSNKEKHDEALKKWIGNNKERHLDIHRKARAKRRALMAEVEYDPTVSLAEATKRFKGVCGICGSEVVREEASIDHIYPLSRGGSHTWDNIQLAHLSCNQRKGVKVAI